MYPTKSKYINHIIEYILGKRSVSPHSIFYSKIFHKFMIDHCLLMTISLFFPHIIEIYGNVRWKIQTHVIVWLLTKLITFFDFHIACMYAETQVIEYMLFRTWDTIHNEIVGVFIQCIIETTTLDLYAT